MPVLSHAAFGFKLDGTLDRTAISRAYFEGDFHRILPPLETWRRSRATKVREDSIFVYKYLSVIYAADSTTRNKAESYMVQLLKLMPTIELVDMYISDNIEAIFKDVQEKYLKQQQYVRRHDDLGRTLEDSTSGTKPTGTHTAQAHSARSSTWIWWTVGGIGTAAIITGTILALNQDSEKGPPSKTRIEP